jgi:DNA-binding HxlR family transcriptional regulator
MAKKLETSSPSTNPSGREDGGRRGYNHPCLIAQALGILGDRWTLLILRDLMAGLQSYSDILTSCGGMSPNVLSDRLKRLEAEGLVTRKEIRAAPPRVEYSLTEKGWSVRPVLMSLLEWGRQHFGNFPFESVGTTVSTDFAVRTAPAFLFDPQRAEGMDVSMVVEISDCEGCNTWSFIIRDGRLHPRRNCIEEPDLVLQTTTTGFFDFMRGNRRAEECGTLAGSPEIAALVQRCFLAS